jgi:glyoxylase-like metal-dependent hydrolase (beta-lactamase superfamily II)
MELKNLQGNTWIIRDTTNTGVYVRDNDAVLIDTGKGNETAREILELVNAKGWHVKWIINTHFHGDHTGGNAYMQKETGCGIAASYIDSPFIVQPWLEPRRVWSAAAPKRLRTWFFEAAPSKVTKILNDGDTLEDFGLEAVDLSGHSHGQIGIRTPDSVFFIADALTARSVIDKYKILFLADFTAAMKTLKRLEKAQEQIFVPSHGTPCGNIQETVRANIECLEQLRTDVSAACKEPKSRDELVGALVKKYSRSLNMQQYVLIHCAISSVLTPLIDDGTVKRVYADGTLKFIAQK